MSGKEFDTIVIGSDHGGFDLKSTLIEHLKGLGYNVIDFGCYNKNSVDYPDIAYLVAKSVVQNAGYGGIIIDGIGQASAIVANKVPGILACPAWDAFTANSAREHDNANVLTLGGQILGPALAKQIVNIFIETPFAGGRHEKRVNKILEIENTYMR